jgi:ATP-dependent DNA helicase RecG
MRLEKLERVVAAGESDTVEFKKSTGLLSRAGETLCGFLNGHGGRVFFGIAPDGQIVGQQIADITQRNVADMISRFEPAAAVEIGRIPLSNGLEVMALEVKCAPEKAPFIFEGKPYQRIGSATFVMPQERYNELLLARSHDHSRWENALATGFTVEQLDQEALLRVVRSGIEMRRLPESTGSNPHDILERLELEKRMNLN